MTNNKTAEELAIIIDEAYCGGYTIDVAALIGKALTQAQSQGGAGFLDISLAPKDGTVFIAEYEDGSGYFNCKWPKDGDGAGIERSGGYWMDTDSGAEHHPKRWIPMPGKTQASAEGFNPTPSPTYDGLLRQFSAMKTLIRCREEANSILLKKDYSHSEGRLNALEKSLESEREMNALLTEELERLKSPATSEREQGRVEGLRETAIWHRNQYAHWGQHTYAEWHLKCAQAIEARIKGE